MSKDFLDYLWDFTIYCLFQSTHLDHGDEDHDLFISYDRSQPVKAKFPPSVSDNPTTVSADYSCYL